MSSLSNVTVHAMLQQIAVSAVELSVTSLATSDGTPQATRRLVRIYNACRSSINLPGGDFDEALPELDENDVTLDEIVVCATALARYLFPFQPAMAEAPGAIPRHRRHGDDEHDEE